MGKQQPGDPVESGKNHPGDLAWWVIFTRMNKPVDFFRMPRSLTGALT